VAAQSAGFTFPKAAFYQHGRLQGPSTSKAATDDGNFLFSVKGKEMKRKRKRKPELKLSKEGDRLV